MPTRPLDPPAPLPEPTRCSECGAELHCGAALGEATCWCDELPPVTPRLGAPGTKPTCLCEACLRRRLREEEPRA